jgi:hypothetical protein
MSTEALISEAVARARSTDGLTASAARRGRNSRFPFVPLTVRTDETGTRRTTNAERRHAFATRDEAVAHAERVIDRTYEVLAERLADPCNRSLREHHGLPRDLPMES